ncbi:uncharacterized protein LOC119711276 [Motacilla alba alba]|uniref:uncharacterized protein LOC119711276 n=1 Tax=Motacilla alba alba TaxID=1094192 RepID=UPI0018D59BE6|nr:uncharacterized protein LOC119711276 [Motacilla alba alba]
MRAKKEWVSWLRGELEVVGCTGGEEGVSAARSCPGEITEEVWNFCGEGKREPSQGLGVPRSFPASGCAPASPSPLPVPRRAPGTPVGSPPRAGGAAAAAFRGRGSTAGLLRGMQGSSARAHSGRMSSCRASRAAERGAGARRAAGGWDSDSAGVEWGCGWKTFPGLCEDTELPSKVPGSQAGRGTPPLKDGPRLLMHLLEVWDALPAGSTRGVPPCEPPPLLSLAGHRALLPSGATGAHPESAEPGTSVTPAALPCREPRGRAAPAALAPSPPAGLLHHGSTAALLPAAELTPHSRKNGSQSTPGLPQPSLSPSGLIGKQRETGNSSRAACAGTGGIPQPRHLLLPPLLLGHIPRGFLESA